MSHKGHERRPMQQATAPQLPLWGQQEVVAYSITSSARPRSGSGTVNPSALAVLRLRISSTFVDCTTGRSGRLLAFEKAPGVETGQTVRLRNAASEPSDTAGGGELAPKIQIAGTLWRRPSAPSCAAWLPNSGSALPITSAATAIAPPLRRPLRSRLRCSRGVHEAARRVYRLRPASLSKPSQRVDLRGLTSKATVVAPGNSSRASSSRFGPTSTVNPVPASHVAAWSAQAGDKTPT